jgi:hypothetical protein
VIAIAAACGLLPLVATAADPAAKYPSRPIRLIIANTTGTSVDTLSRVLAVRFGEELGQQIVSDNRAGAGGTIGAEIASQAAPDGHTLLISSTGMQVIAPQIYARLNYHPVRDFEAISLFAITQNLLVMNPGLPFKSVKELIAHARANPGKLRMSNAGAGFQSHLAGVLFTHMAGVDVLHVPYKGGASLIAVMSNESVHDRPRPRSDGACSRRAPAGAGHRGRETLTAHSRAADHRRSRRSRLCLDRLVGAAGAEKNAQADHREDPRRAHAHAERSRHAQVDGGAGWRTGHQHRRGVHPAHQ